MSQYYSEKNIFNGKVEVSGFGGGGDEPLVEKIKIWWQESTGETFAGRRNE